MNLCLLNNFFQHIHRHYGTAPLYPPMRIAKPITNFGACAPLWRQHHVIYHSFYLNSDIAVALLAWCGPILRRRAPLALVLDISLAQGKCWSDLQLARGYEKRDSYLPDRRRRKLRMCFTWITQITDVLHMGKLHWRCFIKRFFLALLEKHTVNICLRYPQAASCEVLERNKNYRQAEST